VTSRDAGGPRTELIQLTNFPRVNNPKKKSGVQMAAVECLREREKHKKVKGKKYSNSKGGQKVTTRLPKGEKGGNLHMT